MPQDLVYKIELNDEYGQSSFIVTSEEEVQWTIWGMMSNDDDVVVCTPIGNDTRIVSIGDDIGIHCFLRIKEYSNRPL